MKPALALVTCTWLAVGGTAHGQPSTRPPAPVELQISDCPDVDIAQLTKILAVELRGSTPRPGRTAVDARCGTDGASLRLHDETTGKSVTTSIDLSTSAAIARSRVLALAIAELVQWSWAEPTSDVPRSVAPPAARPRPLAAPPQPSPRPWQLQAFGGARLELAAANLFLGGGARASLRRPRWALAVEGLLDHAQADLSGARAEILVLSGATSVWYVASAARYVSGVGVGARLGQAWLRGTPQRQDLTAQSTAGLWGGPCLLAGFGLQTPGWVLETRAELGFALARVEGRVADLDRIELGGAWVGIQLGGGFAL